MSKKIKRLICGLMSVAMLAASAGTMAFADEPAATAAPAAEATAAPAAGATAAPAAEATAAPAAEATAAPTEAPAAPVDDKYANDAYYEKAVSLCMALGIIEGDESGNVNPQNNVTRAEMAAIVLRALNVTTMNEYAGIFADVPDSHWGADAIQTAYQNGIINGVGDGKFEPDGNVLYEQVMKMLVCALNYNLDAEKSGGYPKGYITVGMSSKLDLANGVRGIEGQPADRGTVIKMVYNALLADYQQMTGVENGYPVFTVKGTLAEYAFDVKEGEGLVTTTAKTTIDASTEAREGLIFIDGEEFVTPLTDYEEFIAKYVTYYYIEDRKSGNTLVSLVTDEHKTDVVKIDADDVKTFEGFAENNGKITLDTRGKNYDIKNATVLYNGDILTEADYLSAKSAATGTNKNRFKNSYDEFLEPAVGTIEITDYNGDGVYDVMSVESYETLVITAATDKLVSGKISGEGVSIDVTTDSIERKITTIKGGSPVKPRNLKKDDVVSLKRNTDSTILFFECTGESATGRVSSIAKDGDKSYAKLNDNEYEIDANAIDDVKAGTEGTFYLDKFNRIGLVASESGSLLDSGEKYAWIMTTFASEDGEDAIVRLFTQDGKYEEYMAAETVSFWGPEDTDERKVKKSEFKSVMDSLSYIRCDSTDIRLCKYKTNNEGRLSKLYIATNKTAGNSNRAVRADTYNITAENNVNGLVHGYYLQDDMIEFQVPKVPADMGKASGYKVGTATASSYQAREGGLGKDAFFAEFTGDGDKTPTVVVRMMASTSEAAAAGDYGTANNNPTFMVKEVFSGVDADGNIQYTINGYQAGSLVSYKTNANTTIARAGSVASADFPFGNIFNSKDYALTEMWNAVDNKYSKIDVSDILREGDICGVQDNGTIIIKMVDVRDLVESVVNGTNVGPENDPSPNLQFIGHAAASETRDIITIGAVNNASSGTSGIIETEYGAASFDPSRAIDTVVINLTSNNEIASIAIEEEPASIYDVINFDYDNCYGDYAFFRAAAKGALQDVYLFRFDK